MGMKEEGKGLFQANGLKESAMDSERYRATQESQRKTETLRLTYCFHNTRSLRQIKKMIGKKINKTLTLQQCTTFARR